MFLAHFTDINSNLAAVSNRFSVLELMLLVETFESGKRGKNGGWFVTGNLDPSEPKLVP